MSDGIRCYHRAMVRPLVVVASLLVACGEAAGPPPTVAPVAPALPSLPELETGWAVGAAPAPWLVVGSDGVSMGGASSIVRLVERRTRPEDREGGESGFLVRPLHSHLSQLERPAHPLGLAIDPEVPFRTVSEILYTLGQANWTELMVLVRRAGVVAALPIALPSRDADGPLFIGALDVAALEGVLRQGAASGDAEDVRPQAPPEPIAQPAPERVVEDDATHGNSSLYLRVTVTASGLMIAGEGGWLAPGCEESTHGPVVTVPVRGGAHDLARFTRCLERVHHAFPEEHQLIVSADPEVELGDVAAAIAAARGSEERPLFHRTLISAAAR